MIPAGYLGIEANAFYLVVIGSVIASIQDSPQTNPPARFGFAKKIITGIGGGMLIVFGATRKFDGDLILLVALMGGMAGDWVVFFVRKQSAIMAKKFKFSDFLKIGRKGR